MTNTKRDISDLLFFVTLILLLLISYFPSFTGEFIGDDIGRIANLPPQLTLLQMLEGALGDRPVLVISIWLDRYVFGLSPGLMRVETLLLFGLLALTMRKLVDELAKRYKLSIDPLWRDGMILLYCLHPLHTQALTHIVQRGIILSSLGGLVATLLLLKNEFDWRKHGWRLALLVWLVAILAKPNIAFLPIFWIMLALHMRIGKTRIYALSAFFLMLLLPIINYTVGNFNLQADGHVATPLNYFLLQGKILLIYAKLILVPVDLRFNYDILPPVSAAWWPGLPLWIAYLVTTTFIFCFVSKKIIGIFFAGALLAFLPESSVFPIMHPIFEHRTLFPMAFMTLGAVFVLGTRSFSKSAGVVIASVSILSIVLSYQRNRETQRLSDWATAELSHTCNIEFLQLHLIANLISRNHHREVREALDEMAKCPKRLALLPCLESMYNLSVSPTLNQGEIQNLKACVHSDRGWEKSARTNINALVVRKINELGEADLKACYVEDFLASQLRYFKNFSEQFVPEINFYFMSAAQCLEGLATRHDPASTFQKIKIRTIKRHHFGIPDDSLARDLAKAPKTSDYNYLRTLLESAPKL